VPDTPAPGAADQEPGIKSQGSRAREPGETRPAGAAAPDAPPEDRIRDPEEDGDRKRPWPAGYGEELKARRGEFTAYVREKLREIAGARSPGPEKIHADLLSKLPEAQLCAWVLSRFERYETVYRWESKKRHANWTRTIQDRLREDLLHREQGIPKFLGVWPERLAKSTGPPRAFQRRSAAELGGKG